MALTLHGTVADNTAVLDRRSAKPIFINGAMEIWQRGTALASSSGSYAADRFWYAGTGMTSQRSTDAPSGFSYSNKLTYGSADMSIGQPIELTAAGEQGMFIAGQKITIAFYGKVDSGTEAISVVINARNSKFSGTNSTAFSTSSDSATLTTDWQRFTNTFTIPTINANNIMLAFELAGIGKTAYFTGIQAELGDFDANSIAPFQHESFGDSLRRCQRYFQLLQASYGTTLGQTAIARCTWPLRTTMRAAPTLAAVGTPTWFCGVETKTFGSIGTNYTIAESPQVDMTVTGSDSTSARACSQVNSATAYFTGDAEL